LASWTILAVTAVTLSAAASERVFKLYPGATPYTPPQTEQNQQFSSSVRPGTKITAYLSNDSFEKVVAFYHGIGKEYLPNAKPVERKLPGGQRLQKTFVILDGAPNLVHSKEWVSVQRPFLGSVTVKDGQPQYGDVRDVTEIVLTEKEEVKKTDESKKDAGNQKQ
jgi:hypothetical protein